MNNDLQRLMAEATRLTRSGQLQAATAMVQRALQGAVPMHTPSPAAPAHPDADVIDVPARVVPDARDTSCKPEASNASQARVAPNAPNAADAPASRDDALRPAQPEQWTSGSFTHQGRTLAFKLYLPPRPAEAPAIPLVLMLHGCTQNPDDFAAGTQMNTLARDLGVAVLYPAQAQPANPQKCWNWFKPQHQQRGRGEPAVLAALTRSVIDGHGIDPARVYVAGLSAGGAMADILGRCHPELFAGVGVHSGLPSGSASDVMSAMAAMRSGPATPAPSPTAMPPLIVFHGDADATVNVRNGDAVVHAALGRSGPPPQVTQGASAGGQRFTRSVHAATGGCAVVEHWRLHGAGHAWSGGSARGSYTDPRGVDASAEMLRFFLAHPKK